MRPPRECWEKTATALESVYHALHDIMAKQGIPTKDVPGFAEAKRAIEALREHVDNAEECEQP